MTTSANVSTEEIISDPVEIHKKFGKLLDLVIDGGVLSQEPSSIIDLTGDQPVVIREGKGDVSLFK